MPSLRSSRWRRYSYDMPTADPWKLIFQDDLPADLQEALEADARENDVTVNDAAGRAIAKRFDVTWIDTGSSFRPVSFTPFRLRVPEEFWFKARLEAITRGGTLRGIILDVLNQHYGLGASDVRRRRRSVV